jgi:hypothetical protein
VHLQYQYLQIYQWCCQTTIAFLPKSQDCSIRRWCWSEAEAYQIQEDHDQYFQYTSNTFPIVHTPLINTEGIGGGSMVPDPFLIPWPSRQCAKNCTVSICARPNNTIHLANACANAYAVLNMLIRPHRRRIPIFHNGGRWRDLFCNDQSFTPYLFVGTCAMNPSNRGINWSRISIKQKEEKETTEPGKLRITCFWVREITGYTPSSVCWQYCRWEHCSAAPGSLAAPHQFGNWKYYLVYAFV